MFDVEIIGGNHFLPAQFVFFKTVNTHTAFEF